MSEAVRELIQAAIRVSGILDSHGLNEVGDRLFGLAMNAKAELSRTPQQLHEERIEELNLQWNR